MTTTRPAKTVPKGHPQTIERVHQHSWSEWKNGKENRWRQCSRCQTFDYEPRHGHQCPHKDPTGASTWFFKKGQPWERSVRFVCRRCGEVKTATKNTDGSLGKVKA